MEKKTEILELIQGRKETMYRFKQKYILFLVSSNIYASKAVI